MDLEHALVEDRALRSTSVGRKLVRPPKIIRRSAEMCQ